MRSLEEWSVSLWPQLLRPEEQGPTAVASPVLCPVDLALVATWPALVTRGYPCLTVCPLSVGSCPAALTPSVLMCS